MCSSLYISPPKSEPADTSCETEVAELILPDTFSAGKAIFS